MLHVANPITKIMNIMTKEYWTTCVENVQRQCLKLFVGLLCELNRQFVAQKLLNAIQVTYPHYYLVLKTKITCLNHLGII